MHTDQSEEAEDVSKYPKVQFFWLLNDTKVAYDCPLKIIMFLNFSLWAGPAMSSWATSYLYLDIVPPAYDRMYCRHIIDII